MRRRSENRQPCSVEGCNRELVARNYCDPHYARYRTHGEVFPDVPIKERRKDRESYISKEGYRYLKAPAHPNANSNGFVLEHRMVMSEDIGRPLHADETVHHRNGIRTDNRIVNLELRTGQHGAGQTTEDLVEWAVQLLGQYAPCVLAENIHDSDPRTAAYLSQLELEMNRFRGRLLGYIESCGLTPVVERGFKQLLKSLSYDAQAELAALLSDPELSADRVAAIEAVVERKEALRYS